jgi:preprotein translocase subunit SecE
MFTKLVNYLKGVKVEMVKVTWPTRETLVESTSVTLVLSIMVAIFIFTADLIISRFINLLI